MQKNLTLLFAAILISYSVHASSIDTLFFSQQEEKLLDMHAQISIGTPSQQKERELAFRDSLLKVIQYENASSYTFDSLKVVGRIVSPDNKLIVYTWNIPQTGGYNNYYGIIQYYLKKEKRYTTTLLKEKIGFLSQTEQAPATPSNWPGALYYKIIPTKNKGQQLYTLLGFDFNNLISNRKTIEVIFFDEFGYLKFASNSFVYEGKRKTRIVFEYAEQVQMVLDYSEKDKMIIFDHLSPFKPSLQGQYQFYGPDFSYDGFSFEDGVWIHKTDIRPEL